MIPLREGRGGSQSPHGPIHFGAVSLKSKYINLGKQKCIFSKALSHFSYKHKNNYGRIIMTYLKRPWCWERLRAGGDRDDRGWDGWMASPTQWTWVWVDSRSWTGDGQGGLACCSPWGQKEWDTTERVNWTELNYGRKKSDQFKLIVAETEGGAYLSSALCKNSLPLPVSELPHTTVILRLRIWE